MTTSSAVDVFTTHDAGAGKPVVVFVHGGGFARGAKRTEGTPLYDNIAASAQRLPTERARSAAAENCSCISCMPAIPGRQRKRRRRLLAGA